MSTGIKVIDDILGGVQGRDENLPEQDKRTLAAYRKDMGKWGSPMLLLAGFSALLMLGGVGVSTFSDSGFDMPLTLFGFLLSAPVYFLARGYGYAAGSASVITDDNFNKFDQAKIDARKENAGWSYTASTVYGLSMATLAITAALEMSGVDTGLFAEFAGLTSLGVNLWSGIVVGRQKGYAQRGAEHMRDVSNREELQMRPA